jgi:hypothetical protein
MKPLRCTLPPLAQGLRVPSLPVSPVKLYSTDWPEFKFSTYSILMDHGSLDGLILGENSLKNTDFITDEYGQA